MADSAQSLAGDGSWRTDWGHLLRTARQVTGMSLSELGAVTGLSKGYLSKLESGHITALNPSRATLAALARALPSFRPLAHMLEPGSQLVPLTFAQEAPRPPEVLLAPDGTASTSPVRLGWRELEIVVCLLALESAAVMQPLTAVVLARAVGRPALEVIPVLDALEAMGVLTRHPPARPGAAPTYQRGNDFEARVGLRRPGDALVLAAALLAQSPRARRQAGRGDL
jgi:transcriptional regulator with XRE-family HTH domain